MKPDWKDAPEWANWLAMDEDGAWWWYENEPIRGDVLWRATGEFARAELRLEWGNSLEQRP